MRGSPFGPQTHHFPCHGPASAWRHSSGEGLQAATGVPCAVALCGLGGAEAHEEGLAFEPQFCDPGWMTTPQFPHLGNGSRLLLHRVTL